jgi:hypothetical protein
VESPRPKNLVVVLLDSLNRHLLEAYGGVEFAWGRHVGVTDGRLRYQRGCGATNFPLAMWYNRWSTMPIPAFPQIRLPRPEAGDPLPFWAAGPPPSASHLFDIDADPGELEDRTGTVDEAEMRDAMATMLEEISAPEELLERVGLA